MREILFRGKRIDNDEWVNGYVTRIKHSDDKGKVKSYYFNALDELGWVAECVVSAETVCQYTGLTDKNGRRFEGDIFQASDGDCIQRYIITWNEYALEWSAECVGDPDGTLPLSEFRVGEIEVIGNIFDNPEMVGERERVKCKEKS